jgi:CubicO group peptidase (beta-lactamase class C family)
MANLVRENRSIMEYFNDAAFSSRIEDLMGKHHIPALSVAVLKDDQVSSAGYGNASFKPLVPCTADTLFDVASCAKSLTAASIALLVEDEAYPEIQYDAIMSSLIPEDFVMSGSGFTEGVTVEDLLSHRTGMAP